MKQLIITGFLLGGLAFAGKSIPVMLYSKHCNVSSPIAKRKSYKGKCCSGRVYHKYITIVAG